MASQSGTDRAGGAGAPAHSWPTGRLLSTAARLVEHEWNQYLGRWGLTHAGVAVLHTLAAGPLSQRELARRIGVEEQTMSQLLVRMERDEHLVRTRDPADGRRRLVALTEHGRAGLTAVMSGRPDEDVLTQVVREAGGDVEMLRTALVALVEGMAGRRWSRDDVADPAG